MSRVEKAISDEFQHIMDVENENFRSENERLVKLGQFISNMFHIFLLLFLICSVSHMFCFLYVLFLICSVSRMFCFSYVLFLICSDSRMFYFHLFAT